jgi:hypothetical protein
MRDVTLGLFIDFVSNKHHNHASLATVHVDLHRHVPMQPSLNTWHTMHSSRTSLSHVARFVSVSFLVTS